MGRPINANAAQTRADLLAVAISHFGRDGFRSATTRGIAQEVGVSFATVHHYFGTKEGLFAECIKVSFAELMEVGKGVAQVLVASPMESRVEHAVRHGFRALAKNENRSRFLLRAFVFEDPELVSSHVPEHRNRLLAGALSLLRGSVSEADAERWRVRLIGLGMLMTRFVSASVFEKSVLGADAFASHGAIEDYLVYVAECTLGDDIAQLAALAALVPPPGKSS